jgi:hypothetical protein
MKRIIVGACFACIAGYCFEAYCQEELHRNSIDVIRLKLENVAGEYGTISKEERRYLRTILMGMNVSAHYTKNLSDRELLKLAGITKKELRETIKMLESNELFMKLKPLTDNAELEELEQLNTYNEIFGH